MGDVYRGLTIRIGADTTSLKSALSGISTAARSTQSALRQLDKAAKLDPSNMSIANMRLREIKASAYDAAANLSRMESALKQNAAAASKLDSSKSIASMANATENVYLNTQKWSSELNETNQKLERAYNLVAKYRTNGAGDTSEEFKEAKNEVTNLAHALSEGEDSAERFYSSMKKSSTASETFKQSIMEGKSVIEAFQAEMDAAANSKFLNDKTTLGVDASQYVAEFEKIKASWQSVSDSFDDARAIEGLTRLAREVEINKVNLQAFEKQAVEAQAAIVRMNPTGTSSFTQITNSMKSMSAAAEEAASDVQRMDNALRLDPTSLDAAASKAKAMAGEVEALENKLDQAKAALKEMDAAGIGDMASDFDNVYLAVEKANSELAEQNAKIDQLKADAEYYKKVMAESDGDAYKEAKSKVDQLESSLSDAQIEAEKLNVAMEKANSAKSYVDMSNTVTETTAKLTAMNSVAETASAKWSNIGNSVKNMGYALYSTVTPMVSIAGSAIISSAEDIDSAYRDMRKTVQGTEEQFESMKQAALEFSQTSVTSADQLLEIEAMGGQLGIATENLGSFAETVSNLDIATNIDADTASEELGQLSAILNDMTEQDFSKFGDSLTRLGNNNATLESNIMDVTSRIASMGTITGFTTPQLLAWATAIASTGQGAESAGTAINNTMSDIESAVSSGGDKLELFAQTAGMTAEEFATAWNETPSDAMQAFIEGLKDIEANGGSADSTLQELGITGVRQKQALLGLMQTIDGLNDNLQMSQDAWDGVSDQWGDAGDAANEAEKKAQGFSGQIQILKNNAQVMAESLADGMVPVLQDITGIVSGLTSAFSALPTEMKTSIVLLGGLSAVAGPAMVAVGQVTTTFANVGSAIMGADSAWNIAKKAFAETGSWSAAASSLDNIAASSKNAAGQMTQMGTSAKVAATGIKLLKGVAVVVAIAAIVDIVQQAVQQFEDYQKHIENVKTATEGFDSAISTLTGLDSYTASLSDISTAADDSQQSVDELYESIAEHVNSISEIGATAQTSIASLSSAQSIISQYAGQTDLSADAQGRLQYAIEAVNEQLGLAITAQDVMNGYYVDADGNVQNLTSSINDLAEAKKREIQADAMQQSLEEAYAAENDAAQAYAQKLNEVNDAKEKYIQEQMKYAGATRDAAEATWEEVGGGRQLNAELAESKEVADNAAASVDALETEYGDLVNSTSDSADKFDEWGNTVSAVFKALLNDNGGISALKEDLRTLGADTEDLASLQEEDLERIAECYDGTAASIVGVLDDLDVEMNDEAANVALMVDDISNKLAEFAANSNGALDGIDMDAFAVKLQEAGVSIETLNAIGAEGMAGLAATFGENTDAITTALAGMNDKLSAVNLSQNELTAVQEQLPSIAAAYDGSVASVITSLMNAGVQMDATRAQALGLQQVQIGDKTFWVSDDGTIYNEEASIAGLNSITIDGKTYTVQNMGVDENGDAVLALTDDVNGIPDGDYTISGNADDQRVSVESVTSALNSLDGKNSSYTITRYERTVRTVEDAGATGGFFPHDSIIRHAKGGIMRTAYHAAGGYIVTRPTVVGYSGNITHIAGEAGAEWIEPHAGGIVPLTNRRYVRPFAEAVAMEMPGQRQSAAEIDYDRLAAALASQPISVTLDSDTTIGALVRAAQRKAAMSLG